MVRVAVALLWGRVPTRPHSCVGLRLSVGKDRSTGHLRSRLRGSAQRVLPSFNGIAKYVLPGAGVYHTFHVLGVAHNRTALDLGGIRSSFPHGLQGNRGRRTRVNINKDNKTGTPGLGRLALYLDEQHPCVAHGD